MIAINVLLLAYFRMHLTCCLCYVSYVIQFFFVCILHYISCSAPTGFEVWMLEES